MNDESYLFFIQEINKKIYSNILQIKIILEKRFSIIRFQKERNALGDLIQHLFFDLFKK